MDKLLVQSITKQRGWHGDPEGHRSAAQTRGATLGPDDDRNKPRRGLERRLAGMVGAGLGTAALLHPATRALASRTLGRGLQGALRTAPRGVLMGAERVGRAVSGLGRGLRQAGIGARQAARSSRRVAGLYPQFYKPTFGENLKVPMGRLAGKIGRGAQRAGEATELVSRGERFMRPVRRVGRTLQDLFGRSISATDIVKEHGLRSQYKLKRNLNRKLPNTISSTGLPK